VTETSKVCIVVALLLVVLGGSRTPKTQHLSSENDQKNIISPSIDQPFMIQRETINLNDLKWQGPKNAPRGESWTFDLFTPPTILRTEDGFSATLPWIGKDQSVINFEILSVKRKLYRLQFSGYFSAPKRDSSGTEVAAHTFMLFDKETDQTLLTKLGENLASHDVDIVRFEEHGPNGEMGDYPRLTIFDRKNNQEFVLTSEPKYWDELWDIQLRSKGDGAIITLSKIGEDFTIDGEHYALGEVSSGKKSLTFIQKVGKDSCAFSLPIPDDTQKQ
jgi:hypothetical protein